MASAAPLASDARRTRPTGRAARPGSTPGRRRSSGFALPLALIGALALLLGSLALQSVGLAARQRSAVELRLQQAEDRLASGAHRLVGTISRRHGCLLTLPLERWPVEGARCSTPQQRAGLLVAADQQGALQLINWEPQAAPGATPGATPGGTPGGGTGQAPAGAAETTAMEVELLLEARGAAAGGPAMEPRRRQAFVFALAEEPRRALDLRSRGLRGVLP